LQVDLSIFNPKARPLLGLDISTSAIKMVELTEGAKGEFRLERYAIEYLPKDAVVDGNIVNLDQVAEAVRRCWKRLGTGTKYVAMSLPTAAVITKKIILPGNLRETEMEVQVESEANQYIPFALDEVNLDFQVIGPVPSSPDEVEVLIAASRKEKVEDRVACAEAAELKPLVMDVESFAVQAAFSLVLAQLAGKGDDQVVALVDIGAVATKVMVMRGDQLVYSREQAFGGSQLTQDIMRAYGMSSEEAEAVKRSGAGPENYEPELLRPFVENLALEVSRALQFFFSSTQFNQVHHIVLAGGCAAIPGIDEIVATRTQVPTVIANPFAGMVPSSRIRPRQLMVDAPLLMVACGLALRRFDQ
jgi:type IV pilus assembly protein PilM